MNQNKVYVPPIKCQGIKTKLVPWIIDSISWNQAGRWIEPFMGSGVVGFNVRPERALFADSNPHIIAFYNAIQANQITPAIVREFLEAESPKLAAGGVDYYYEVRKRFNEHKEPLDFLFLNRSCFNGVIRFNKKGGFNVPFGHKPERFAKAYVTKIVNQVKYVSTAMHNADWSFVCQPYSETIQDAKAEDFIYCDPPYVGRHVDYYNGWTDQDEKRLFELLSATSAKFMLSTWHSNIHRENQFIEDYWDKFNILTKDHFYHVGAKESNRKAMLEALIVNFDEVENSIGVNLLVPTQERENEEYPQLLADVPNPDMPQIIADTQVL